MVTKLSWNEINSVGDNIRSPSLTMTMTGTRTQREAIGQETKPFASEQKLLHANKRKTANAAKQRPPSVKRLKTLYTDKRKMLLDKPRNALVKSQRQLNVRRTLDRGQRMGV